MRKRSAKRGKKGGKCARVGLIVHLFLCVWSHWDVDKSKKVRHEKLSWSRAHREAFVIVSGTRLLSMLFFPSHPRACWLFSVWHDIFSQAEKHPQKESDHFQWRWWKKEWGGECGVWTFTGELRLFLLSRGGARLSLAPTCCRRYLCHSADHHQEKHMLISWRQITARLKLLRDCALVCLTNGVNLFSIIKAQGVQRQRGREGQFMQENLLN